MRIRQYGLAAGAAILLLALVGGALTACGDSDQGTDASPSPEASTPSPVTTGPSTTPTPSPSPSPLDTESMSEEELAAAAEESTQQAAAATEEAAQAAESAASDGSVSEEEVAQVVVSAENAEQLIAYADSVLDAYASEYAAYADALLDEMEQMNQYLMDIDEELGTLIEYAESAEATAEQLSAAAQEAASGAQTAAEQLSASAQQWASDLSAARSEWEAAARATEPTDIAKTRAGALQSARVYLQTIGDTLTSGQLTKQSLQDVYAASANAVASLKAQGGQLAQLGAEIEGLTGMLASGQVPQAKAKLPEIESLFP